MLGQAVQADASRACGSPAAAARLAQAVANSPVTMANAVLPQGALLQMMGPAGLMQAVQIASQALLPSMTEGFQAIISQCATAPGPAAMPQPGCWPYAAPTAAAPYGRPTAGGAYPQPPVAPAGYSPAPGWQGTAAPSYPAPYPTSAGSCPPPAGWAMSGMPAAAPPATSPLQAGLPTGSDCSAATHEAPSAPPLPDKGTASASKFPALI